MYSRMDDFEQVLLCSWIVREIVTKERGENAILSILLILNYIIKQYYDYVISFKI